MMRSLRIIAGAVWARLVWLILVGVMCCAERAEGQTTTDNPYAQVLRQYRIDTSSLPTDRVTAPVSRLPPADVWQPDVPTWEAATDDSGGDIPPEVLARLRRPFFDFAAAWEPEAAGVEIASYDLAVKMATPPLFGPPPPFLKAGFSLTDIVAPAAADLPAELYEVSLGFDWMRHISERWMMRLAFSSAFASDGKNNSSDAWQFRGAVLGIRQVSETLQLAVGAVASGRRDYPVFPGAGAIWTPGPACRLDLLFPQPRVSWRIFDDGLRQQWLYVGGGISGGTWAYQRTAGLEEVLTYNEWRVLVGWEWVPAPKPGVALSIGHKLAVELGYVFGREFEFDSPAPDLELEDALLLRATLGF